MDRRTLKTRRALHVALLRLLTQRAWDDIDVQGLCEAADVGRSTFYEHYPSREALVADAFAEIGASFAAAGAARSGCNAGPMAFVPPLAQHMHAQREAFRALLGRRSNAYVRQQFQRMMVDLIRAELSGLSLRPRWRLEALVQALGGAAFATLHWWIAGPESCSAQEIAALICSQSRAMVDEASHRSPEFQARAAPARQA